MRCWPAVNDLERPIGTYLYGRRMYETMVFWQTASTGADQAAGLQDFAELWRVAEVPVERERVLSVSACWPLHVADLARRHAPRN
jgi:hypothetical protein